MQNHSSEVVEYEFAGFWVRLAAYAIDMAIVTAGLLIVRLVFLGVNLLIAGTVLEGGILFHYTLKDIVLYLLQAVYFVVFTYHTGTTLGKKVLNLRVVCTDEEKRLNLLTVIYRETIGRFLSGFILCVGYLLVGIDKEKRGLHDILCDTRVIYAKKIKLYPVYQKRKEPEFVPHMVEESAHEEAEVEEKQVNVQEDVQAQWNRILNPQKEEQKIEGDS